jgi:hypothetical protein
MGDTVAATDIVTYGIVGYIEMKLFACTYITTFVICASS